MSIQQNGSKFSARKLNRRSLQYWKLQKKKKKKKKKKRKQTT
jgi:hypothetical protein